MKSSNAVRSVVLTGLLTAALSFHSSGGTFVIVQDLSSCFKGEAGFELFKQALYNTNNAAGTRAIYVAATGCTCQTLADLTVPQLLMDGERARKFRLASAVDKANKKVHAASPAPSGGSGVLLGPVLSHLRAMGISGDVSLLIDGSPFVVSTEFPAIDLTRNYPLDGVLELPPETSRLGMAHLKGVFKGLAITWQLPVIELATESQRRVQRFLSLAAVYAGGALVNWTTDPSAAALSFVDPSRFKAEEFKLHAGEPCMMRSYVLKPLKSVGLDPAMVQAIEELQKTGVRRCVAASWAAGDVDLHVDCSAQFPGEPEVSFARTNTPHLRLLGDRTQGTGKGFEIVAIDDAVNIHELKNLHLDLYRSPEPTHGQIVLLWDDVLYRKTFEFDTRARGDAAKDSPNRAASMNWIEVRVQDLLRSPVNE